MQHSRLKFRASLREREWWLVDKILPGNAMHMIVGGSGTGKTTWLLDTLHQWERGESILGYTSHPCEWAYVSCDRLTWETDKTLRRIGLGSWDAPIYSAQEMLGSTTYSMESILDHPWIRDARLIVIEGLQVLLPDTRAGQQQNKVEMLWCQQVNAMLFDRHKSVIAVTHNPKMKKGERYAGDRSEYLGSQSVGASTSTHITVRNVYDGENTLDQRIVTINGRDFKEFSVLYDINSEGRFVNPSTNPDDLRAAKAPSGAVESVAASNNLDLWLMAIPARPMSTGEIMTYAESVGISRATVYRWIESAQKREILSKIDHGTYIKNLQAVMQGTLN